MIFRRLLRGIGYRLNRMAQKKRKVDFESTLDTLLNSSKRRKCVFDECDIIIDVNKKGYCTFNVVSDGGSGDDGDNSGNNNNNANNNKTLWTSRFWKLEYDSHLNRFSKEFLELQFPPTSSLVALDCEFVGLGEKGRQSSLGRCSIVDYEGSILLDIYARPDEPVTDYRTRWSGITPAHMANAVPLEFALVKIAKTIQGKIVVGHDVSNDFAVLGFHPSKENIRDTFKYKYAESISGKRSLKALALEFLGIHIQKDAHCSVVDAQTVMKLYRVFRTDWETDIFLKAYCGSKPTGSGGGNDNSGNSSNNCNEGSSNNDNTDGSGKSSSSSDFPYRNSEGGNANVESTLPLCDKIKTDMETVTVCKPIKNAKTAKDDNKNESKIDMTASIDNTLISEGKACKEENRVLCQNYKTGLLAEPKLHMVKSRSDSCLLNLKNKNKSKSKRKIGCCKAHFSGININNIGSQDILNAKKENFGSTNISGTSTLIRIVKNSRQGDKKTDSKNVSEISTDGNNGVNEDITRSLFASSSSHLFDDKFWPDFNE